MIVGTALGLVVLKVVHRDAGRASMPAPLPTARLKSGDQFKARVAT
jgi:hypothetical protein